MSYTDGMTGESRESSFSNSVSQYFDENGYLCNDIFDPEVLKLQSSLTAEKKSKWIWQRLLYLSMVGRVIVSMHVYWLVFCFDGKVVNVMQLKAKV